MSARLRGRIAKASDRGRPGDLHASDLTDSHFRLVLRVLELATNLGCQVPGVWVSVIECHLRASTTTVTRPSTQPKFHMFGR
eukprot:2516466-Rhodomonas_salina.2